MDLGLTKSEHEILSQWSDYREDIVRPDWDSYFLQMANLISERSHDAETQHGAVLVNDSHEIIGTGYNGHIRNISDDILPNLRPFKYPFCIHAEANCLMSCCRRGQSTLNSIMYITGKPCITCFQMMYQCGISKIIHGNRQSHCMQNQEENVIYEILLSLFKDMKIIKIPNFN